MNTRQLTELLDKLAMLSLRAPHGSAEKAILDEAYRKLWDLRDDKIEENASSNF